MRTKASWTMVGVALCCMIATLVAAAPGAKPRAAWEYKFVSTEGGPSKPEWSDGPNSLGAEGWELVSATADANKYVLYFKRPKQPKQ